MIGFRWIVVLAIWTLMVGPMVDLSQQAPTAPKAGAKTGTASAKRR